MSQAVRVVDRVQDMADWDQSGFADGYHIRWNATANKFVATPPTVVPVTSVFGRSGDIVLSTGDITTALGYTPLQTAPVTSVFGRQGAVVLQLADVTTALGYTPLQTAPITTVFGRTGDVVLGAADVTTALGYTPLQAAPVTTVLGRTGDVVLTSGDVTGALGYSDLVRLGVANTFTLGQVVELASAYGTFLRLHNTSSTAAGDWRWNIGSPGNNDGFLLLGRGAYTALGYDLAVGNDGGVLASVYISSPSYRSSVTGLGAGSVLAWSNTGGNFNGTTSIGLNYGSGTQNVKAYLGVAGGNFQITRNDNALLLQTSNVGATTITVQQATAKPLVLQGAAAQTANLQEWQDSTGALLCSVTYQGHFSSNRGFISGNGYTYASLSHIYLDSAAGTGVRIRPSTTEVLTLYSTTSPTAQVTCPNPAYKALVIKAALNQTGNMVELQDSTAATLTKFTSGGYLQEPRGPFNVRAYGAKGDGTADDTAAFQQAFDAAVVLNGEVLIPPPEVGGAYMLSAPVVIQPGGSTGSGSGQCRIRVKGMGNYQYIQWTGPNNSSMFVLHGVKDSLFDGLNIQLNNQTSGVIVWDCQPTPAAGSMSNVRWLRCRVVFGTGGHNIAWRTGQSAPTGGTSDHANFLWDHCQVNGAGSTLGDIGFHIGGNQSIPQLFLDCSVSSVWQVYMGGAISCLTTASIAIGDTTLAVDDTTGFLSTGTLQIGGSTEQITYTGKTATTFTGCTRGANGTTAQASAGVGYVVNQFVTNVPGGVASVGVYLGAEALTWIGGGGSSNAGDFMLAGGGRFDIIGYRGESGNKFLRASRGTTSAYQAVTFQGCELATYAPNDGICFLLKSNTHLRLTNCNISGNATAFTSAFITEAGGGTSGCIEVTNCVVVAADPFYTLSTGNKSIWPVVISRVAKQTGGGVVSGYFANPAQPRTVQALPYAASMTPDPRAGEYITLSVTDGSPFTINAPAAHIAGSQITFEITNNFTAALGAATWASGANGYNFASAWVNPDVGATATVSFAYNGTVWVETGVTGAAAGGTVLPTDLAKTDVANTFTVGPQTIQIGATTTPGLVFKGILSQTSNFAEFRDSNNTLLLSISYQGQFISNRGITCGNGYTFASQGTAYLDSAAGTKIALRPAATEVLTLLSTISPTVQITNPLAANKALVIKAAALQTGSLTEWQKSDATVLCKVDGNGLIYPLQAATASAPAYVKGALYFDTTLGKLRIGGNTAWETVTSS